MTRQETNQEQATNQEASNSRVQEASPANVLEFLRKSNIINFDIPLKTLFEQIETLQPDPSTEWGIVSDSGHLVLVWADKYE